MGVERPLARFPHALDQAGAEGDVGDEVAVHDVEVDPVRSRLERYPAFAAQIREVRVQDAGGSRSSDSLPPDLAAAVNDGAAR